MRPASVSAAARSARIALLLTSIAAFMGYLDVTIVNVSFPSIQADFPGSSTDSVIWVLDVYSVVLAGLLLTVGRISDVVGHRRMFLLGVGLFTSASAACAMAPSLPVLIAARAVQAVGAAVFTPASLALILSLHKRELRASAVATWTSAAALAAAVGPALGGLLTGGGGTWRWIFVVNVPVGIAVIAVAALRIPRLRPSGLAPDRLASVFLLSAGFLAALAITRGRLWGWGSTTTIAVGAMGVVALLLFVLQNARSSRRVLDRHFLARTVLVSNGATFLVSLAFFSYLLTGVLFMTGVWGYSVLQSGLAMSAAPICAIPAALFVGRLDRRRARAAVAVGSALIAAYGLGAVIELHGTPRLDAWLALGAVVGAGIGASLPLLNALAVEEVGEERFAAASALNSTVRQFAAVLAFAGVAAVVGSGIDALSFTTYQPIWWAMAASGAAAVATIVFLPAASIKHVPLARPIPAPEPEG